ncbi:MAG: alanine/ornithine racemase family PLP-dependent enzyme [Candidatus Lokiarchaeota archaeon]|nr:alanine/ornithine racemase family PLP-dependent enzyme [Candidatus Lokiarchaeota archaeon]
MNTKKQPYIWCPYLPHVEIDLSKIYYNAKYLKKYLKEKGISIIGITKVVLGDPKIAKVILDAGIPYIGDSRMRNIKRLYNANLDAKLVLIRNPSLSEIDKVVKYADISLNSEWEILKNLSKKALKLNKKHGVIIMVEMGDLREGIMPENLDLVIKKTLKLEGIVLLGLGTNLKCFAGVIPDQKKMSSFSEIAEKLQQKFNIRFKFISGGNSANYKWVKNTDNLGLINNLRLGTAIIMGAESIEDSPIPDLKQDTFSLIAEIVQISKKPKNPTGKFSTNAFGEPSIFKNKKYRGKGVRSQALLNIGRQDIEEKGLVPVDNIDIMGASSDYLICDIKNNEYKIGEQLRFKMSYEALLRAMTSPFVEKRYVK